MRKATRSPAAASVVAFPQQHECQTGSETKPGALQKLARLALCRAKGCSATAFMSRQTTPESSAQPSALSAELIFFLKAPGIPLTIDSCRARAYLSG